MLPSTVRGEALTPRRAARLKKKVAARARAAKARAGKRKADLGDPAAAAGHPAEEREEGLCRRRGGVPRPATATGRLTNPV